MKEIGVIIDPPVEIGENVEIGHYTIIRPYVKIGNNCSIRHFCFLAERCRIGNHVKIFQYSNIGAGSEIGNDVYIGPRVLLTNTRKISHGRKYTPKIEPCLIEDGARIGAGSIILPGVRVRKESFIGAGSVVTESTEEYGVYFGHPAKFKRYIGEEERLEWIWED